MLSGQHRFHGYTSLSYVYRQGSTVRNKLLSLRFVRNARRQDYRIAVIVSRKVHKSAVNRNRVRRRLYEIIRTQVPIVGPYDIALSVYGEELIAMPPKELESMVIGLFKKAGLYGKPEAKPVGLPHAIVKAREEGR